MDKYDKLRMWCLFCTAFGWRRGQPQANQISTPTFTDHTFKTIIGMTQFIQPTHSASHSLTLPFSSSSFQREQLQSHENKVSQLEELLNEHKRSPVPTKGLPYQNYTEKENYLQYEVRHSNINHFTRPSKPHLMLSLPSRTAKAIQNL